MKRKPTTKNIAGVSLLIMAAGFLATISFESLAWVRFLRSGFEAGLVGGLADWFAVTALFRHPLGIPIPHTAILPNNRDRVTKALVSTVENELLSKTSIRDKMKQFGMTARALDVVERGLRSGAADKTIVSVSDYAVKAFPWDRIVPVLEKEIDRRLQDIDVAALAARMADYGYSRQWDVKALDFALDFAEDFINRESTVLQMGAMASDALGRLKTNGLMQFALNAFAGFMSEEKLGETIRQFLQAQLYELRDERNVTRNSLLATLRGKLDGYLASAEGKLAMEEWKNGMLNRFDLSAELERFLEQARAKLIELVHSEGYAERTVVPLLLRAVGYVREEPERLERIEAYVQDKLSGWIESNHHKIGTLIEENVSKYDNETLIAMLEDKIGSDLQWIRVNGAICGFGIGLVLAAVNLLVA